MPRSFLFALVLLSLSLGLNVTLAWRVKELTPRVTMSAPTKVGVQVGAFEASDLEGHIKTFSFNTGKPTLIYYIDPECHWCKANSLSFRTLANAIRNKVRVVMLSQRTQNMQQFMADTHPADSVFIIKSSKLIHDLGLTATPQTFLIDTAGRVQNHWYGAYTGHSRTELEKTFDLHLPDVKPRA